MIGSRWLALVALAGVVTATGCSDEGGSTLSGELGYASFRWLCAGDGDVACVEGRVEGFPPDVALSSTFEIGVRLAESVPVRTGSLRLAGSSRATQVSSGWVTEDYDYGYDYDSDTDYDYGYDRTQPEASGTFTANEEGEVSVLGLADDDTVADYATVSIRQVTSLAVVRACDGDPECDVDEHDGDVVSRMNVGEVVKLRVEPYASGALLAGHLEYQWASLEPEVAEISSAGGNLIRLTARRSGTAYIEVEGGGHQDTVAVEVLTSGGPQRRPPDPGGTGGETDTDMGTDTDTGTDADTGTGSGTDTDAGTGTTTGGMQ